MPALAPASMVRLQRVRRPSIESALIASPAYSMTWPVPPPVPIWPITASARSLAVTQAGGTPSMVTRMFFAFFWRRVWVASTCSTSEVPMPCASAPKAPRVEVWLSPQTTVMPGWMRPCSGPTTWTMPFRTSPIAKKGMCWSAVLRLRVCSWIRDSSSSIRSTPRLWPRVGMLWSATASVRSGRRTGRAVARRPAKAWGEVTSWIRCRSM